MLRRAAGTDHIDSSGGSCDIVSGIFCVVCHTIAACLQMTLSL